MILEKRIPLKYWLSLIKWDVLIVTLFSLTTYTFSLYSPDLNIPVSIGTFLGTAIALLLSFKINQSYERWWEARIIWGAIVNDSRSLVIQLKNFSTEKDHHLIKKIALRQIAWAHSLGQRLREQNPLSKINQYISSDDFNVAKEYTNAPLCLINLQSKDINTLHQQQKINNFQQIQLDSTVQNLCASMGKAERIKNTAFPKTYRITLHFSIYIFLITLSLSLTNLHSIAEIPLLIIISLPFFLLEKIAQSLQDPFENRPTDTSVTSIAITIETDLKELIDNKKAPYPVEIDSFFVM
ncbi:bestrophin family ion channel [Wenyingzhuangia sp. chi5]|uniref:Bestrophin family ion channel n=1 Tax=Wenyingzhuangia gilva TaxID=3057677 RepID=A0ABT8VS30_9FLAO|nr:bestrophin family ion channel [Wenyingzhuangia sp. chi5]MDO3694769.1 bestrophin family ion channel [Wenyingzhuangia sp. chi5]